jgi:hypothetical protein
MKKYAVDFLVGLVFGVLFFFGVPLLLDKNPIFLGFQYYLVSIFFFLIFAVTPYSKNHLKKETKKIVFIIKALFVFCLGFFLPTLIWGLIVYKAVSDWTLF